jgi:hypothetical protein
VYKDDDLNISVNQVGHKLQLVVSISGEGSDGMEQSTYLMTSEAWLDMIAKMLQPLASERAALLAELEKRL